MRLPYVAPLLLAALLAGCSEAYTSLEDSFAVEQLPGDPSITGTSITITGPSHRGATSYRELVDVYVKSDAIGVAVAAPFHKSILIPAEKVSACAMTCFGMKDRHIDLLIASTGSVLSFPNAPLLTDWCWESKKQIFPGDVERAWQYSGGTLPAPNPGDPQFASREAYANALLQSCRGF